MVYDSLFYFMDFIHHFGSQIVIRYYRLGLSGYRYFQRVTIASLNKYFSHLIDLLRNFINTWYQFIRLCILKLPNGDSTGLEKGTVLITQQHIYITHQFLLNLNSRHQKKRILTRKSSNFI
jgi:hypothetical protein